jgi:hypothetical protein
MVHLYWIKKSWNSILSTVILGQLVHLGGQHNQDIESTFYPVIGIQVKQKDYKHTLYIARIMHEPLISWESMNGHSISAGSHYRHTDGYLRMNYNITVLTANTFLDLFQPLSSKTCFFILTNLLCCNLDCAAATCCGHHQLDLWTIWCYPIELKI